eukprot:NODE_679_length_4801_cov_0.851978.p5 type:complete len:201 gc:universal NODE_679_length_4801_cov_0.851978:1591-989(-)
MSFVFTCKNCGLIVNDSSELKSHSSDYLLFRSSSNKQSEEQELLGYFDGCNGNVIACECEEELGAFVTQSNDLKLLNRFCVLSSKIELYEFGNGYQPIHVKSLFPEHKKKPTISIPSRPSSAKSKSSEKSDKSSKKKSPKSAKSTKNYKNSKSNKSSPKLHKNFPILPSPTLNKRLKFDLPSARKVNKPMLPTMKSPINK